MVSPQIRQKKWFDSDHLTMRLYPRGFIAGNLALAEGATLTNDAATPCHVQGVLSGTGTLAGKFVLDGATWQVTSSTTAGKFGFEGVTFVDADVNALRNVGKIAITCAQRPKSAQIVVAPALGLENLSNEDLASIVECTVIGEEGIADYFTPSIENGQLILKNAKAAGTVVILK